METNLPDSKQYQARLKVLLKIEKQAVINTIASENQGGLNIELLSDQELSDIIQQHNLPTLNDKLALIKNIEAALCQIELDLYGLCSDCEEPIEAGLLEADPTTQRCAKCAAKYQQNTFAL